MISIYEKKPKGESWGAGAIVMNKDYKFLLGLRTDNGLWGSPGGGVEDGETPLEAVKRELLEETGLTVIGEPTYLWTTLTYNERVVWNSFCFLIKDFEGELKPQPGEVEELKWFDIFELFDLNLFNVTKQSFDMLVREKPGIAHPLGDYLYLGMEGTPGHEILKSTALEQMVSIHNPGTNGANGHYDTNGTWVYDKKGKGKNVAAPKKQPNSNQVQTLKQSYIQYFQNKKDFKVLYQIKNGDFSFPDSTSAIKDGLVKDNKSYMRLFKEQYIHFALLGKK